MLLDELKQNKDLIEAMAAQFGARRLRVFGSVARGDERPDSDVDILVVLPRGYDLITQRLPLTQNLEDMLHRKVELIPEHELNPHIREQVMKEAVEL